MLRAVVLQQGELAAENDKPRLLIQRLNPHQFGGSDRGGQRAAVMYSLIVTAKMNGVYPQAWLTDLLARIAGHPAHRLDDLLPWRWAAARASAVDQAA